MRTEFRLLGNVEAAAAGRVIDVGPARQRCVLAALLLDLNHVVTTDQLLDRVWGEHPPRSARGTVYSYLSRLRTSGGIRIERCSGGYLLAADPASVDLFRFRDLVGRARAGAGDDQAAACYAQALGLWRGPAFGGLDTPWINTARDSAEADRLAAELDHTDIRLRRGEHGTLLGPLLGAVAERPLDERLAGQLVLALYRCGRRGDALASYERTRRRLRDELGADPSAALRELQRQVLAGSPDLELTRHATSSTRCSGWGRGRC
jgi:DNA-binding SARP family transcriptional activator